MNVHARPVRLSYPTTRAAAHPGSASCATQYAAATLSKINYQTDDGAPWQRELWPLGLLFCGQNWTLFGWCALRSDFRHFRVERVQTVSAQPVIFSDQKGRRLTDFYDQLEQKQGIKVRDKGMMW